MGFGGGGGECGRGGVCVCSVSGYFDRLGRRRGKGGEGVWVVGCRVGCL